MDVALVASDVVDNLLFLNREGILCKLYIEKAYDHVNWRFVEYMLTRMGFREKWYKWINSYITITSFVDQLPFLVKSECA